MRQHGKRPELPSRRILLHGHTEPRNGGATANATLTGTSGDGGGGGGGGGSTIAVTDGSTTVNPVSEVNFTAGAAVTDLGGGVAGVAITGGGGLPWFTVGSATYPTANDAIDALNTAGKGVVYFPAGTYTYSAALHTITAPFLVLGDGGGLLQGVTSANTIIQCSSQTASLFTVSANVGKFSQLALVNTYAGTPSAGAGITVNGASLNQKIDYDSVTVHGFYIDVDVQVGAQWSMRSCFLDAPVLYGLKVNNTVNTDAGDWAISDSWIYSQVYNATAGIYIVGAGGGKIVNCKFNKGTDNKTFTNAIQLAASGLTGVLLVEDCSIENYSGDGVHLDGGGSGYKQANIIGCQWGQYGNGTGRAVYTTAVSDIVISPWNVRADTGTPTAFSLNNGSVGYISPGSNDGFGTLVATSSFTNLIDNSAGGGSGTVTSVATGTGLTGGPITTTGTVSLANTAVAAGSYTNADITVDAQGRLTAASNGSTGAAHYLVIASSHSTPLVFDDIVQTSAGDDFVYTT